MSSSRRQVILTESARLFSEFGLSATTIREIADAVGFNSGTLYHYFSSKDAIFSEILMIFLADLVEGYQEVLATPGTARDRLTLMVRVSLEVADRHPYATEVYQNEYENLAGLPDYSEISQYVEVSHSAWYRIAEEGVRDGEFNSGIDTFEFQWMIRECVFQSVRWHRDTLSADTERIISTVTSIFLDGFAPAGVEISDSSLPPKNLDHEDISPEGANSAIPVNTAEELRAEVESLRSEIVSIRHAMEKMSGNSDAVC